MIFKPEHSKLTLIESQKGNKKTLNQKEMNELAKVDSEIINSLVINGDLSRLNQTQKLQYYKAYCDRLGLDPLAQPFKLLKLSGKEVLYCDRSGAQQLNKIHKVSHEIKSREYIESVGVYQVTARASLPDQRFTDSIGAVNVKGLSGDNYANAIMKAETKAKRRATLDLLGLGILDETEVETIPGAKIEAIEEKSVDELKREYMVLLQSFEEIHGHEKAKALDPDNWKREQTTDAFKSAIAYLSNELRGAKAVNN